MPGGGGKGKGKEEEPLLSFHGVAYINLSPLLYPGGEGGRERGEGGRERANKGERRGGTVHVLMCYFSLPFSHTHLWSLLPAPLQ